MISPKLCTMVTYFSSYVWLSKDIWNYCTWCNNKKKLQVLNLPKKIVLQNYLSDIWQHTQVKNLKLFLSQETFTVSQQSILNPVLLKVSVWTNTTT